MRRWVCHRLRLTGLVIAAAVALSSLAGCGIVPAGGVSSDEATIFVGNPETLDPAAAGDATSAGVIAQIYETLTTVDNSLTVRPALAESWEFHDGGRSLVFKLRRGSRAANGEAIGPEDVIASWRRVLDPTAPSPLASLLDDVQGAIAYRTGQLQAGDVSKLGLRAAGDDLEVLFDRPATDFPAIAASPTLAVATLGAGTSDATGGYSIQVATRESGSFQSMELEANDHYWAGRPAIGHLSLITDLAGQSPVQVFQDGGVDYTPIGPGDASWIAYDRDLGPSLRTVPSLDVTYFGFDVRRAPFDDVRVRRAFAEAVDWNRIVELAGSGSETPATGMVPLGIPGRSATSFMPTHDPEAARRDLSAAGYPGGAGFPRVTLVTPGTLYDEAIIADLERELGVSVAYETMDFGEYYDRLTSDPPAFWAMDWIADYPARSAMLRILLGSGQVNNYGGWSSSAFDDALEAAASATDPAVVAAAYDRAEMIVRDEVPVIPVSYGMGYALARDGLLGAAPNGLGILRMAGLAWGPGR